MVVRWRFEDPLSLEVHTFEINPSEGGSPSFSKQFQTQNTSAPDGKTLIFEGRDTVQRLEFEGTILSEDEYNTFAEWFDKRRQIKIIDDLGREFWVLIESFSPTRVRAASRPWKHTYKVTAIIVDWPAT